MWTVGRWERIGWAGWVGLLIMVVVETSFAEQSASAESKIELRHATGFSVSYHDGYKRVVIKEPWRGATEPLVYLLVPQGEKAPHGVVGKVIEIPLTRVAVMSTTYLPHLDVLGVMDTLVAVDKHEYVNTPSARERIRSGDIHEVGGTINMNVERMIALKTDAVLSYTLDNREEGRRALLSRAGVRLVLGASYLEATPLGRTEWIKFTALFFNKEQEANRYFAKVEKAYGELRDLVAKRPTRPSVLVGAPFKGVWHVPGGKSFSATLIKDAGGDYLWKENDDVGGVPVAFESVFAKGHQADIWLNPSHWQSLAEGRSADKRFDLFEPFKAGRVFNNNRRLNEHGGNDIWEGGVARPHDVLRDLIRILHPDTLPDHELIWYQRLPKTAVGP